MKAGVEPRAGRDLSRLRSVGSTGSPLSPEGFRWVYEKLGSDTWLFSTSGGTDVCTAFVGGVPTLPVYEGELQARARGAQVEAWSGGGEPGIGRGGERTLSGKILEIPVKRILMGAEPDRVASRDSLANPQSLDYFASLASR